MPYRTPARPGKRGELVTVRRYTDPVVAHADAAHLTAAGIQTHVVEASSFNPMLSNAIGGLQLQVGAADVDQAEEILAAGGPGAKAEVDDGEGPGVVRCPECELAYCSFEKPRVLMNAPVPHAALVNMLGAMFGRKRWRCHRCAHVWDDPKAGPAEMTKLEPGDPRPVFRLRRAHAGMGLFVGLIAAFFVALVFAQPLGELALLAAIGVAGGAWFIGSQLRYDVCSEPECRTPLASGVEECPRCKGAVAGAIQSAEAHYSAAADFRRDLAALRHRHDAESAAKPKKSKKKTKVALGSAGA